MLSYSSSALHYFMVCTEFTYPEPQVFASEESAITHRFFAQILRQERRRTNLADVGERRDAALIKMMLILIGLICTLR